MKRALRLLAFFVVGLLLGGVSVFALAETCANGVCSIPASSSAIYYVNAECTASNRTATSQAQACSDFSACPSINGHTNVAAYYGLPFKQTGATCYSGSGGTGWGIASTPVSCPVGQNWTLSGSTCTRPDCVSPQTRGADGTCSVANCTLAANAQVGTGRYAFPYPQPSGKHYCVDNCQVYGGGEGNIVGNVRYMQAFVDGKGGTASNCSRTTGEEPGTPVADPTKTSNTPCAVGDGVMSFGGKVVCVPTDTAGATVPPVVTKKTNTETKSDGSQVITTTTQTCTGDGACSTNTSTTVTGKPDGTPGQAGTPGTATGTENTTGAGSGGKGDDPTSTATVTNATIADLPTLYTPKYENGLVGVWSENISKIKQTPLYGLTASFTPNIAGGTCPAWSFGTNIGPHMDFGSSSFAPPCWVFTALKSIFLITALLTARRLIFGG